MEAKKVTHLRKAQEGQRNQLLIRVIEPWLDSNKYFFMGCLNQNQKILALNLLEAWVALTQFLETPFLNRELIWINSCKAILSHELNQNLFESKIFLSRTHVCLIWAGNPAYYNYFARGKILWNFRRAHMVNSCKLRTNQGGKHNEETKKWDREHLTANWGWDKGCKEWGNGLEIAEQSLNVEA